MKNTTRIDLLFFIFLSAAFFQTPTAFSADGQSASKDIKTSEVRELFEEQSTARKTFLEELQSDARKINSKLLSVENEEQKKKILEQFRAERLKKVQEFQALDEELSKQIEIIRLRK